MSDSGVDQRWLSSDDVHQWWLSFDGWNEAAACQIIGTVMGFGSGGPAARWRSPDVGNVTHIHADLPTLLPPHGLTDIGHLDVRNA